jgi:transposase
VVLDNLAVHKQPDVRLAVEAVGAQILFLPPYSPDFNPIEQAFAKLKAFLRAARPRTFDQVVALVATAIDLILRGLHTIPVADFGCRSLPSRYLAR